MKLFALFGAAFLLVAPQAHADTNSYLDYLASHHIATGLNSPGFNISAGLHACEMLHAGTPTDLVIQSGGPAIGVDLPGLVVAAQHNLCPDTLH